MNLLQTAFTAEKPSKRDAQAAIRQLAEDHPDLVPDLAPLYLYFMQARLSSKAALKRAQHSDWDWLRLALPAVSERRPYLHYIYSTGDRLVATDGHRIHTYLAELTPGLYDPDSRALVWPDSDRHKDDHPGKYPDIQPFLDLATSPDGTLADMVTDLRSVERWGGKPYTRVRVNNVADFDNQYLTDATAPFAPDANVKVHTGLGDGNFVVWDGYRLAILAGLRPERAP